MMHKDKKVRKSIDIWEHCDTNNGPISDRITLTFDALSYETPHVVSAEVAPVWPLERVHLQ